MTAEQDTNAQDAVSIPVNQMHTDQIDSDLAGTYGSETVAVARSAYELTAWRLRPSGGTPGAPTNVVPMLRPADRPPRAAPKGWRDLSLAERAVWIDAYTYSQLPAPTPDPLDL